MCPGAAVQMPDWPSWLPGMQCNLGDYFLVTAAPSQTWKLCWLALSEGPGSAPGGLLCQALLFQPLHNWQ